LLLLLAPEAKARYLLLPRRKVRGGLRRVRDDVPGDGGDEDGGEAFYQEEQPPWGDGACFAELEDQPG